MSKTGQDYYALDLEAMNVASNYYTWILDAFVPFLGSRVLEVGAGNGNFSQRLLAKNPELLVCLEPSSNMALELEQRLAERPHVEPQRGLLSHHAQEWAERFDTILYVNVLEHVEHDREEVRLAVSCLKPGGHLLIFVPALPWLYGKADERFGHFRRYTQKSLVGLFQNSEAEVRHSQYWDILGVLPWWVSFVLLKRNVMNPAVVRLYDWLVVPFARYFESKLPVPIGKNLLLVAQKFDRPASEPHVSASSSGS